MSYDEDPKTKIKKEIDDDDLDDDDDKSIVDMTETVQRDEDFDLARHIKLIEKNKRNKIY